MILQNLATQFCRMEQGVHYWYRLTELLGFAILRYWARAETNSVIEWHPDM